MWHSPCFNLIDRENLICLKINAESHTLREATNEVKCKIYTNKEQMFDVIFQALPNQVNPLAQVKLRQCLLSVKIINVN